MQPYVSQQKQKKSLEATKRKAVVVRIVEREKDLLQQLIKTQKEPIIVVAPPLVVLLSRGALVPLFRLPIQVSAQQ